MLTQIRNASQSVERAVSDFVAERSRIAAGPKASLTPEMEYLRDRVLAARTSARLGKHAYVRAMDRISQIGIYDLVVQDSEAGAETGLAYDHSGVKDADSYSGQVRIQAGYVGPTGSPVPEGHGLMIRSNDRGEWIGKFASGMAVETGAILDADRNLYEGEWGESGPHGLGVLWSNSGDLLWAGRWSRGQRLDQIALNADFVRS